MNQMSALREINYQPPGPIAAAFMRSNAFVRGIKGPFGSGKSTACIMEIARRSRMQAKGKDGVRRTRWAIVRNTYPELKTTTIKSWHQWFPAELGTWRDSGPPTHIIRQGDVEMEVIFIALDRPDDISKLLSLELTGAWINEAREIPKAMLDGLTGRVGRFPSVLMGGCTWSGILMDTNPPDNDHWWYKLAEEMKPEGYAFFSQPSGLSPQAENLLGLGGNEYYKRMIAGKDPDWIKVYVHAEYGFVRDGKAIYADYRDGIHATDKLLFAPGMGLHMGMDFGLTPAAVFGQRTVMGHWRILSEVVTEDMGAKNFARMLKLHIADHYPNAKFASITGDPAGDQRAATDEQTVYDILRQEGIVARPASTNDPIIRRDAVNETLRRTIDGVPGFQIYGQKCPVLRKAMAGGYCLKRLNVSGEERYREVPDKNKFSHVAEALQYMMLGAGEGRALTVSPEMMNMGVVEFENGFD